MHKKMICQYFAHNLYLQRSRAGLADHAIFHEGLKKRAIFERRDLQPEYFHNKLFVGQAFRFFFEVVFIILKFAIFNKLQVARYPRKNFQMDFVMTDALKILRALEKNVRKTVPLISLIMARYASLPAS